MSLQTDTAQQQAWWRRRLLHDWLGSQAQLPIERNPRRALYEYARRLAVLGAVVTVNVVIAGLAVLTFLDSAGPPPMAAVEVAAAISAVLLLSGLLTPLARARAIRAGLPSRDMLWALFVVWVVALGVAVDVVSARSLRFHPGAVVLLGAFVAAVLLRAFPPLFDTATRLSGAARNALARTEKAVAEDATGEPGPAPVLSAREIVSFLADTELFRKVDRRALRKLAEATATRPVGKGQTIFAQGDHGDQMFVLINGAVRLVMRSATGEAVELARLWAPAAFGEVALTDPGDRTATAEAVERSVLLVIDRIDLLELLRSDSDAMEAMLQSQGAMIRHADQLAADVVFLKPQSRVARALLDLAESDTGEGRRPRTLRITRADLASKVGAPQSQVTRILRRFQRLGYIRMVDWTIELLDPAELRRRAGR